MNILCHLDMRRTLTQGEHHKFYFSEVYVAYRSVAHLFIYSRGLHHVLPQSRQMELYINGSPIQWTPESPNAKIDLDYLGGTPAVENLPLQRCQGDCDIDDHCAPGLFCYQVNKGGSEFPGCNNPTGSGSDYCVDPKDIENIAFFGTGGWDDDWRHSKGKTVTLQEGVNEIKIKVPFGADNAPNMDYMKIEGVQSPTIQSKFRNPPHFVCKNRTYAFFQLCLNVRMPLVSQLHSTLFVKHSFDWRGEEQPFL